MYTINVIGSTIFASAVWNVMKDYLWEKAEGHDALLSEDINENGDYIEIPVSYATKADDVVIELNGERYVPYTIYETVEQNGSHQHSFR